MHNVRDMMKKAWQGNQSGRESERTPPFAAGRYGMITHSDASYSTSYNSLYVAKYHSGARGSLSNAACFVT